MFWHSSSFNHIRQSIGTQSHRNRHLILFIITLTKTTTASNESKTYFWVAPTKFTKYKKKRNNNYNNNKIIFLNATMLTTHESEIRWWIPYTNTATTLTSVWVCVTVCDCVGVCPSSPKRANTYCKNILYIDEHSSKTKCRQISHLELVCFFVFVFLVQFLK